MERDDIVAVLDWLEGSDWHYDMIHTVSDLEIEFGPRNVKMYWSYEKLRNAVDSFHDREHVLEMLKYVRFSHWALSLEMYYHDLADQFGAKIADWFTIETIIDVLDK